MLIRFNVRESVCALRSPVSHACVPARVFFHYFCEGFLHFGNLPRNLALNRPLELIFFTTAEDLLLENCRVYEARGFNLVRRVFLQVQSVLVIVACVHVVEQDLFLPLKDGLDLGFRVRKVGLRPQTVS